MDINNFSISEMTSLDLNLIKETLKTDFDDFWNYNIFESELQNPNSKYFVIKSNNSIIGFAGCLIIIDEAEITNIVIKKDFRGKGISKILLKYLINFCKNQNLKQINLEVSSKNTVAISLYKSFDFEQVGLRKKYYKDSDAILLTNFLR